MKNNYSIEINNISKIYKLYNEPLARIKEAFHPFNKKYYKEFHALKDVSFSVQKGEIVGIVGKNGTGKSTLLQIITGVLSQSSGEVIVNGNISALLELGAGFNPELTGIDNIFFKCSLLGYSTAETNEKLDDILTFADIGDFVYQPIKTYSSGMYIRLAFAVAISVDPEILIIDEALSVGDYRFRQKCLRKLREFKEKGKTILFVSHDTGSVIEFCTQAIWLVNGQVEQLGSPSDICKNYIAYMSQDSLPNDTTTSTIKTNKLSQVPSIAAPEIKRSVEWEPTTNCSSFGLQKAVITDTSLSLSKDNNKLKIFEGGENVVFYLKIDVIEKISHPIVGFHLCDVKGVHILGLNTYVLGCDLGEFQAGTTKIIELEFEFPFLKTGSYSFSPAIADGTHLENTQQHWVHDAYIVEVATTDESQKLGHYLAIKSNYDIRVT